MTLFLVSVDVKHPVDKTRKLVKKQIEKANHTTDHIFFAPNQWYFAGLEYLDGIG